MYLFKIECLVVFDIYYISRIEEYARKQTDKCPFIKPKTFCSACKVHCYSEEMKRCDKEVMKYA
ncbi:MAG: nitrous oxide-stimulated promoter family protein [Blautia sp.]|uniref:nitrous oxide-stimulated promoter family protein n=1 Tax=Blautia sp. TaxID=1955243 RepID=UPI003993C5E3